MKILVISIHLTSGEMEREMIYGITHAIDRAVDLIKCMNIEFFDIWDFNTGEVYLTAEDGEFTYVATGMYDLIAEEC